jgi:hypothetical protein
MTDRELLELAGKQTHIGTFESMEDAAFAASIVRIKLHGEYAHG